MSQEAEDLLVREGLQAFAQRLDKALPYGWGFILLCFPFGAGGRMNWVIWSEEHGAWWGPAKDGYTRWLGQAGRYSEGEARALALAANRFLEPPQWHEVALPDPLEGWL